MGKRGGVRVIYFHLTDEEIVLLVMADTLQLREMSGDADDHSDSKVFLSPDDKGAKENLTKLPVFVPAADLRRAEQETPLRKQQPLRS